jgi:hypothetical protein
MASGKNIVPGSNEWSKKRLDSQTSLKEMAGEIDDDDDGDEDDDKLSVSIKALTTSWINKTAFGRLNIFAKPPQALLSRQSAISVAVHCGPGELFAVAYNSVAIGNDGRLVFVEGVTVLPPGNRWITLALRCMGKNVTNFGAMTEEELEGKNKKSNDKMQISFKDDPNYHDRPLSNEDIEKCKVVNDLMQRVSSGPVCRAPGIIYELEQLFRPWIGDHKLTDKNDYKFGNSGNFQSGMKDYSKSAQNISQNDRGKNDKQKNIKISTPTKGKEKDSKVVKGSKDTKDNRKSSGDKSVTVSQDNDKKGKKDGKVVKTDNKETPDKSKATTQSQSQTQIQSQSSKSQNAKNSKQTATTTGNQSTTDSDRQFGCPYCELKFASPIYIYRHVNTAHKNETIGVPIAGIAGHMTVTVEDNTKVGITSGSSKGKKDAKEKGQEKGNKTKKAELPASIVSDSKELLLKLQRNDENNYKRLENIVVRRYRRPGSGGPSTSTGVV